MKRATLLAALAVVFSLSFASVADAHILTFKRARNATFNIAREDCERLRTCDRFGARDCARRNAHKVVCVAFIEGQNARGTYECHRQVTVSIPAGSYDRFVRTRGDARCTGPGA